MLEAKRQLHDEVIRLRTELKFYQGQSDKVENLQREIGRLMALLEVARSKEE